MSELILGILCGLALSLFFSFGPAFFSLLRTSLQYGYRRSYPFAFGVFSSDALCVGLALTFFKNVDFFNLLHNVWVASIAGVVIFCMGIYYFRKEVTGLEAHESRIKFKSKDGIPRRRTIFFQGFLINSVNPFVWLFWFSVVALTAGELNLSLVQRYIFFGTLLATTLGMDILKCKLASSLQSLINAKMLNITNKVCAFVMFGFAIYIVASMVLFQVSPKARERNESKSNNQTQIIKKIHNLQMDSLSQFIPKGRRRDTIHYDDIDSLPL